jgi:UDPglucose 6-dehydrogenase
MRIAMIGYGYVGLVSGACFSDFGHDVVCVDKDASKIEALNRGTMPIFEPGSTSWSSATSAAGRLSFTTDLEHGRRGADASSSPSARPRAGATAMPT